jgi:hypothetical protein
MSTEIDVTDTTEEPTSETATNVAAEVLVTTAAFVGIVYLIKKLVDRRRNREEFIVIETTQAES